MTRFIQRIILRFRTAEDIASGYKSYTDFAVHASPLEKERVMEDVITKANKLQREVAAAAKEINHVH